MKLPDKLEKKRDELAKEHENEVNSTGYYERVEEDFAAGFNACAEELLPLLKKSLEEFEYYEIDFMVYQIKQKLGDT